MRKFTMILPFMLLSFFLISCTTNTHHLKLLYSDDHVKEIKIVEMKKDSIVTEEDYTLIKDINTNDFVDILNDIQTIEYKTLPPSPAVPSGTVILIVYDSGEYEIVSKSGPKQYKYSEKHGCIMEYHSYDHCSDDAQFDQTIEKWSGDTRSTKQP